jgi:hypothetical protein
MAEVFSNHPGTTLAAAISSTARPVTFSVASAAGLPGSGNFRVLIDNELFLITGISGSSLTGSNAEGTTAATHASGAGVQHVVTAGALQQLEADIQASMPPVISFNVGDGTADTIVGGYAIAPRNSAVSKCKIVVNGSDPAIALTFTIKQNGVSVFSSDPTVAAGTAAGTLSTSTGLTSVPLTVAADDLFSLDITSGSSAWQFTAQLEK